MNQCPSTACRRGYEADIGREEREPDEARPASDLGSTADTATSGPVVLDSALYSSSSPLKPGKHQGLAFLVFRHLRESRARGSPHEGLNA